MKKKKEYNVFNKIRAALRDIWRYSPQHREAIKLATAVDVGGGKYFCCPICTTNWPIELATVDHQPPLGALTHWGGDNDFSLGMWAHSLFYGPVRVICKPCHKKVTASQRKKAK
jgi:hypothetical protein